MRFGAVPKIVNATMRFDVFMYPTALFGAVLMNQESYGAVRCGLKEGENPTVRFGTEPHLTDRKSRAVKNPGIYLPPHECRSQVLAKG